jgi:inner membrane protein
MDTLMHALTGAVLASYQARPRAGADSTHRSYWWAAILGAEAPDLDIVLMPTGPLAHLHHHRGLMHSVFMAPVLALGIALILRRFFPRASFARLLGWTLVGCLVGHLFLDWITSFGTRLLLPFDNTWFAGDWVAEVEPMLLLPPLLAALVGLRRPRLGVTLLRWAGVLMLGVLAYRGAAHALLQHTVAQAYRVPVQAVTLEPVIYKTADWEYVVARPDRFELGRIHLSGQHEERAVLARRRPEHDPVLRAATESPPGRMIMHFARNPLLSWQPAPAGYTVFISDLRGGHAFNFEIHLDHDRRLRRARRDYRHGVLLATTSACTDCAIMAQNVNHDVAR